MSVLFIDTDGELWYNKVEEINAQLIKMPYTLNGEEYYDDAGRNSDYVEFFSILRNNGTSTTSALNTMDYINYFEPFFAKGEDILYISFGTLFSATFDFMNQAVDDLSKKYKDKGTKFYRFDTNSISMATGFMQYYGGKKLIETGSIEKTIEYLESLRDHVYVSFIVDDLNHLKKGGRISSATAFAGTLFGIKPVLKVVSGKIENVDKVKGAKKVVAYLANEFKEHCTNSKDYDIWIMHADCIDSADSLRDEILKLRPDARIHVQIVGPVIGTHCGPGTLGIIFYADHC